MRYASLLLACALVGCAKPEPPRITPHSVKATKIGPTGLELHSELDVENPNGFALKVQKVDGKLKLGPGTEVGAATLDTAIDVPAHATKRVESDMTVRWSNIAALAPLAASAGPVPYVFEGTAKIGSPKLNLDIPFELRGQLTREQMIQAGLRGLGIPLLPQ
jgi:LEA14-like dessication related protein